MKKKKIKKELIEFKKMELGKATRKQIKGGNDDVQCPFCQRHVTNGTLDG